MKTYICLLRGINVGGNKKIKMADLRELCDSLGLEKVATYIQSGNVVFQSDDGAASVSEKLYTALQEKFGFEVKLFVLEVAEWREILAAHPYIQAGHEAKLCHVTLLSETPSPERIQALADVQSNEEQYTIVGRALYGYFPNGLGRAVLSTAVIERKLKVDTTTRNWATSQKLLEMGEALQ